MSDNDLQLTAIRHEFLLKVSEQMSELFEAYLKNDVRALNEIGAHMIDSRMDMLDALGSHAAMKRAQNELN